MNEGRCDERLKTRVEEFLPAFDFFFFFLSRSECPEGVAPVDSVHEDVITVDSVRGLV
jgi:hypothetical protein